MKSRKLIVVIIVVISLIIQPTIVQSYYFPWRSDSTGWTWTTGWHDGAHLGRRALDFAPGSKIAILAARSGRVIQVCKGTKSRNIVVKHSDGTYMEYWHLKPSSIPNNVALNKRVIRGQKLGVPSGAHSYDGCGKSSGSHIHWVFDNDLDFDIQGWLIKKETSRLSKNSSNKYPGNRVKSTNVRNYGIQVDCWEGLDVVLIDRQFIQPGIFTSLCYGPNTISSFGSSRVKSNTRLEMRAGEKITLSTGFKATTLKVENQETFLRIVTGKYP